VNAHEKKNLLRDKLWEHFDSCERCGKAIDDSEMCDEGRRLQLEFEAILDSLERD
jgi:hypothetical protein